MTQVSREKALKDPAAHVMVAPGVYMRLGKPALPSAKRALPGACEPPGGAAEGSWHMLQPGHGGPLMRMKWSVGRKDWTPSPGRMPGNRMAHTSEHLAAHGWVYVRAATSEDVPS